MFHYSVFKIFFQKLSMFSINIITGEKNFSETYHRMSSLKTELLLQGPMCAAVLQFTALYTEALSAS